MEKEDSQLKQTASKLIAFYSEQQLQYYNSITIDLKTLADSNKRNILRNKQIVNNLSMSTRTSMSTRNNYSSKSSRNFGFTGQDQDENDYLDPSSSSFSASGDGSKKTNVNALDIAILNIQDCLQIASIINNNANMFDKYL